MAKTREGPDRVGAICRAIRRAILERALTPGDKLPEDALGDLRVAAAVARSARTLRTVTRFAGSTIPPTPHP